jgi:hypothetical protein
MPHEEAARVFESREAVDVSVWVLAADAAGWHVGDKTGWHFCPDYKALTVRLRGLIGDR